MTIRLSHDPESRARHVQMRRELRRSATDAERVLWQCLRGRHFRGGKFRRQYQMGRFSLDFFRAEERLAVEADGGQYSAEEVLARDTERTRFLEGQGIRVLRFTNREILLETEGVQERILEAGGGEPSP